MIVSNTYNMDCVKGMKDYPNKFFDLAIVDPPYGIDAPNFQMGANKRKNKENTSDSVSNKLRKARFSKGSGKLKNRTLNSMRLDWDEKPTKEYFDELFRVSKNQIIWGGNYFDLPPTRCVICWNKVQPWENFSQWEMAWTSFDKVASMFTYSSRGGSNIEKKIHPTQKPVALYEWLIMKYAKPNYKILDTHLGSGSSRIAAYKNQLSFVGFEKDKEYFKDQQIRFEKMKPNLDVFLNFKEKTKINKQTKLFE